MAGNLSENSCKENINRIIKKAYEEKITDENVKNITNDIYTKIMEDKTRKNIDVINDPINELPSLSDDEKEDHAKEKVKYAILDFFNGKTCDGPEKINYKNYLGQETKPNIKEEEGKEETKEQIEEKIRLNLEKVKEEASNRIKNAQTKKIQERPGWRGGRRTRRRKNKKRRKTNKKRKRVKKSRKNKKQKRRKSKKRSRRRRR